MCLELYFTSPPQKKGWDLEEAETTIFGRTVSVTMHLRQILSQLIRGSMQRMSVEPIHCRLPDFINLWFIHIAGFGHRFRFGLQTKLLHCTVYNFSHCIELDSDSIIWMELESGSESESGSVNVNKPKKSDVVWRISFCRQTWTRTFRAAGHWTIFP